MGHLNICFGNMGMWLPCQEKLYVFHPSLIILTDTNHYEQRMLSVFQEQSMVLLF